MKRTGTCRKNCYDSRLFVTVAAATVIGIQYVKEVIEKKEDMEGKEC